MIQKSSLIRGLISIVFTIFLTYQANAQQDPQYTQYMYNTMSVNPGYAGQRDVLSLTGLYRTQWVGVNGAPETMNFSLSTPLSERVGLGVSFYKDEKYKRKLV